jgi:AcrR family transcriptional regulator
MRDRATNPDTPDPAAAPVKERLLEAAIVCLQREGYAVTTARDVATRAGANLRSIGYHYGSTRGLLLAAISANWRRWLAPLIAAAEHDERPPAERLAAGMALFSAALAENAPMAHAWLEAVTLAPRDAELRATLAANQREFGTALARNLTAAGQSDAERRATAIVALCDGLLVHYLLYGEALPPAEVATRAAAALAGLEA